MDNLRRLKIAMLIRHYNPVGGGAERYCVELTEQLAKEHEVHLFAQTVASHSENVAVHKIPQWLERPRYINQLLFSWFTRKATKGKFDIIHSHDMVSHADIYTLHVPCVRTRWTESKGIRKWLRWANTLLSPRKLTYLWLEKVQMSPKLGKQLIAVSEYLSRNITLNYPNSEPLLTIAYPGIHPNSSKPQRIDNWRENHRIPENAFLLLFVANDFKKKGLQPLIDALNQISQPDIHLVVAGNGNQNSIQIPQNLQPNIHFLGAVMDMDTLYPQADALAHPTTVDTYGMTVLEAMAHQLPVIVSNQYYCGFSEHLSNREALLLDDPTDPKEITKKVMHLFNNPDERLRMSQLGQQKSQLITWNKTSQATLSAYQLALNSRASV